MIMIQSAYNYIMYQHDKIYVTFISHNCRKENEQNTSLPKTNITTIIITPRKMDETEL